MTFLLILWFLRKLPAWIVTLLLRMPQQLQLLYGGQACRLACNMSTAFVCWFYGCVCVSVCVWLLPPAAQARAEKLSGGLLRAGMREVGGRGGGTFVSWFWF